MNFSQGRALIVGVGGDLPNTVNDAEGIEKVLTDEARCAYPKQHVQLLTGPAANRNNVLGALDALVSATSADSTVVIYFSGHGERAVTPAGPRYYLLTSGYDLESLKETAISGEEFSTRLRAINAQKLLLLLDCCHAGGFDQAKAPLGLTKAPVPPEVEQALAEGHGRVGIASSRAGELSYAGAPYSVFTYALLETLSGFDVAHKDGFVRATDLALHAAKVVPARTKSKQNPVLSLSSADDFAVAYYAAGDAQPKGLPFSADPEIEPAPGEWARTGRTVTNTKIVLDVGFVQPGWTVRGDVIQVQGDAILGRRKAKRSKREGRRQS